MANFSNNSPATRLSLLNVWHTQLTPALPLLADISHLSISQVQHALPHLLKVLTLQVQQLCMPQHGHAHSKQLDFIAALKNGNLPNLPLQNLAEEIAKNGLNFTQLPKIVNFTQASQQMLFPDPSFYQQILGILAQRTGLTVARIEILFAWTSLLCLVSLHQRAKDINTGELKSWLSAQSEIGFDANDDGLLAMYHQQFYTNAATRFEQFYHFSKSHFTTLLSQPTQQQLFAIVPVELKTAVPKPVSLSGTDAVVENNRFTSQKALPPTDAIFTPKASPQLSFVKILQQYWIATSIVLTGLVFGIIALVSANSPKPTPETAAATEKPIHDVAIMKIDSSPATTTNPAIANPKITATNLKTSTQSTPKANPAIQPKEAKSKNDTATVSTTSKSKTSKQQGSISAKPKPNNEKATTTKPTTSPTKASQNPNNKKEAVKTAH